MQPERIEWSVVYQGVSRSDASAAFRGTQWQGEWPNCMDRWCDDEDALIITLQVTSADELAELLALRKKLQPQSVVVALLMDFAAACVSASICNTGGSFRVIDGNLMVREDQANPAASAELRKISDSVERLQQLLISKPG